MKVLAPMTDVIRVNSVSFSHGQFLLIDIEVPIRVRM